MESEDVPVIKSSPFSSPMYNYGSSIVILTNPHDLLTKMELSFRSMTLDSKGNPIKIGQPLMNELGINSVTSQVQSIVNQVTVLSSLNKYDIIKLMDFLADTLAKDLMVNRITYAILEPANVSRDKIYFTALTTAYICMKRAFEGDGVLSDKRFWGRAFQEIHSKVESQPKKGGILSRAMGWNKN